MKTLKEELDSFIAFDVETATSQRNSICQLGYSKVKNLSIIENKSFLIQPPKNEYSARNSCIHGITSLDTIDKPLFPEIWREIKHEFKSNILVAHNASFDSSVLIETMNYYQLRLPRFSFFCSYQFTNLNLKALCKSLNIILDNHHDAMADAKSCAEAMIKIIQGEKPDYSLINIAENKSSSGFEGHERLLGDILKPNLDIEDKDNPFYSKKVVLTGVLKTMARTDAAIVLKNKGADIDTDVTKRTKYVIVGSGAGPSKLKKIEKFKSDGYDIEIIDEEKFLIMVK